MLRAWGRSSRVETTGKECPVADNSGHVAVRGRLLERPRPLAVLTINDDGTS